MSMRVLKTLTPLFIFCAVGAGAETLNYKTHSAESYQKQYPTLSTEDAEKMRKHESSGIFYSVAGFGIALSGLKLVELRKPPEMKPS